jgi:hypothetical protein
MAREWKSHPAPKPTSITECARRYHAAAVALSQTLGVSLQEVLREHRESVTAVYIESSKCEVRLPAGVTLPPLVGEASVVTGNGSLKTVISDDGQDEKELSEIAESSNREASPQLPTTIPVGLPCAGQAVADLKPAQLRMLLSKVDQLAAEQGSRWRPLLEVLACERQRRVANGVRPKPSPVRGEGHGG